MSKLRVIVADDERPAREFLKSQIAGFEDVEIVGEADNGQTAFDLIVQMKPDLALLDLQMPEMSGIEVVRALRKTQTPLVAFITAYDRFAVQAFELNAVDYLLKPVEKARLREMLNRATERLDQTDWRTTEADRVKNAASAIDTSAAEPLERIPVKKRDEIFLVPVAEIVSIVADGELLFITTSQKEKYSINFRLKDLEVRLDPKKFVRLSRGAIVNLDMIASISPMPGGTFLVTLKDGQELVSSRLQSKILRAQLLKL
jgi:two-component system, LytTR family, response regulator